MNHLIKIVFALGIFTSSLFAQECDPDSAFINSSSVVFPLPFIPDSAGTGIPVDACIGEAFELTFFIRVPESIIIPVVNIQAAVTSAVLDSVLGLPAGVTYTCSTDGCLFVAGEIGCIYLSGIPDNTNTPGDFNLSIIGQANTAIGPLDISFPNDLIAPGEYILTVNPEGTECDMISSNRNLEQALDIQLYPNPVGDYLQLEFENLKNKQSIINIYHISGKQVFQALRQHSPSDRLVVNTSQLVAGQYFLEFRNGPVRSIQKIVKF